MGNLYCPCNGRSPPGSSPVLCYNFHMKNLQKGFVAPILIAIIALLVVCTGMYVYKKKTNGNQTSNISNTSTAKQNIITPDKLKNEISQCENSFQKENAIGDCITKVAIRYEDYDTCKKQLKFRIAQAAAFGESDVNSYVNNYIDQCTAEVAGSRKDLDICGTLTDSGAYRPRTICYTSVAVNKKDISICNLITFNQNEQIESCKRQILATEALSIPLSQWKTYANLEYGFTFKYPPNITITESNKNSTSTGSLLNVETKEMGGFKVQVKKPKDYSFNVQVDSGNYIYLPDQKIWFDTDTKQNICSNKVEPFMNPKQILNDRGYKVAHFGTGDACFSYGENIAVTTDGFLIIIGTMQDCNILNDEISIQKMMLDSVDYTKPLENVCM